MRRKDAPSSGVRLRQGGNMAAERPSAILRLAATAGECAEYSSESNM